jgi:hypothetical protein
MILRSYFPRALATAWRIQYKVNISQLLFKVCVLCVLLYPLLLLPTRITVLTICSCYSSPGALLPTLLSLSSPPPFVFRLDCLPFPTL